MAYTINRFDGSVLTVVEDGTIDRNTDIKLVGKNYAGYGEVQNENFVFLLENFSSLTPPPRPVSGQIWFDADNSKLKFYDGGQFRTTGGAEVSNETPSGLTEGDFWWDTDNEQLFAYNGTDFILVGPQDAGEGITQMQSRSLLGTDGITRSVIVSVINDNIVHIISNESFTVAPDSQNAIPGFDVVKKGITLVNTRGSTGGVTSTDHIFWGTARNAEKLGGIDANQYVQTGQAGFNSLVEFGDDGLVVGNGNDLLIEVDDDVGIIKNQQGDTIILGAEGDGGNVQDSIKIKAIGVLPGIAGTTVIGTEEEPFQEVYADNFRGLSEKASALVVNGTERFGDVNQTTNTIAVRDASGDLRANLFRGTALAAKYADLAEIYSTDQEYPVGTVLTICSHENHEVEQASEEDTPIGVVSLNPAYIMNSEADGQPVALAGRTPVRIIGAVQKGDSITTNNNGTAVAEGKGAKVGIALESNNIVEEKLVECFIKT